MNWITCYLDKFLHKFVDSSKLPWPPIFLLHGLIAIFQLITIFRLHQKITILWMHLKNKTALSQILRHSWYYFNQIYLILGSIIGIWPPIFRSLSLFIKEKSTIHGIHLPFNNNEDNMKNAENILQSNHEIKEGFNLKLDQKYFLKKSLKNIKKIKIKKTFWKWNVCKRSCPWQDVDWRPM